MEAYNNILIMGILNIFKKKTRKNKYQVFYESISEILKLLQRRKKMVENLEINKTIIDLEFDSIMFERIRLQEIIENGSIAFLGEGFKNDILVIFNEDKINRDEIFHIWDYLVNEQDRLSELF